MNTNNIFEGVAHPRDRARRIIAFIAPLESEKLKVFFIYDEYLKFQIVELKKWAEF